MNKTAIRIRTGKAALLAGLCFSALLANAATVSVDCDAGNTITAALGNVKPGDTVLVSGTCNEQVSFAPEMVRITLDGQKKTTIQHPGKAAPSPHTVFIRGKDITIKGITVTGGLDGIHLAGPASAELDGNVVVKAARAGIHIDKGSVARILNNTVQESGAYRNRYHGRLPRLYRGEDSPDAGAVTQHDPQQWRTRHQHRALFRGLDRGQHHQQQQGQRH